MGPLTDRGVPTESASASGLLYGHDSTIGIVGLHPTPQGRMRVYRRAGARTEFSDEPFFPFFFLADAHLLEGFRPRHWVKPLEGSLYYSSLCAFEQWSVMWEAVRYLLDAYNRSTSRYVGGYAELDIIYLTPDPVSQYLLQTGRTLFKGMRVSDLRRLHLTLHPHGERPPAPAGSRSRRTTSLTVSDCGGWNTRVDFRRTREALTKFIEITRTRDPDLIQGESFTRTILPFLMETAARAGLPLRIGRDGSEPFRSTTRGGGTVVPVEQAPWEIAGRHILDLREEQPGTQPPIDATVPSLPGTPRPQAAPPSDTQPEAIDEFLRQIVDSTPSVRRFFALSRIGPSSFGAAGYPGFSRRFEHVLVREYLRARHSLPAPAYRTIPGPIVARLYWTGLLGPVLDLEISGFLATAFVESGATARGDLLGVMPRIVSGLIDASAPSSGEQTPSPTDEEEASPEGARALLNDTFQYLSSGKALFGDPELAHRVLLKLSPLLEVTTTRVRELGGRVVEIDHDGMLLVPPEGLRTAEEEATFVRMLASLLPRGVAVRVRDRYSKVLSFRRHTHAFLRYDQTCLLRGPYLHPRGIEKFGRVFLDHCIVALLNHDIRGVHEMYAEIRNSISQRTWDISDFARVETLGDTLETYTRELSEGIRKKSAAYEVALAGKQPLPPGSRVAYYVTGNDPNVRAYDHCRPAEEWDPHFPDENTGYYLRRLDEFAARFSPFFEPGDFRAVFSSDELFPFDPTGVVAITLPVREEGESGTEGPSTEFGIWIDE